MTPEDHLHCRPARLECGFQCPPTVESAWVTHREAILVGTQLAGRSLAGGIMLKGQTPISGWGRVGSTLSEDGCAEIVASSTSPVDAAAG